jgi:hypothetical protein
LGGLDNFEKLMRVNPVCLEYREVGRDLVELRNCAVEDARIREVDGAVLDEGDFDGDDDEGRKR